MNVERDGHSRQSRTGLSAIGLAVACGFAVAESSLLIAAPAGQQYRIETLAGNGEPGDTPQEGGKAQDVSVDLPFGVEYGPDGALYITTVGSHRVLRLDPISGKITSVAGNGRGGYSGDGGPATEAMLNEPYEVRFDSHGNMVIVEMRNHLIRRVDAKTGIISTVAGDGVAGHRGDGGPARRARFRNPHSIILDEHDNIYISDLSNHRVRRIDAKTRQIEALAGNGEREFPQDGGLAKDQPLLTPQGIAIHDGDLWIASFKGHMVWRLDLTTGVIHRIAGTGKQGFTGDGGDPLQATFDGPRGITMTSSGMLFVVEGENNIIRAIDTVRRSIRTIAGAGPMRDRYTSDGIPATEAPISQPHGLCVSQDGSLVLSDTRNHRVRRLVPIRLASADEPATLPDAKALAWEEPDLSGRLMEAAHAFVERKIADAAAKRKTFWKYDFSSREKYVVSIAENRAQLRVILGVVDERVPLRMERYGDDAAPALVAETNGYRVFQVRWPVLAGVFGEGLLVRPKERPVGHVILVPDASVMPEQTLGLAEGLDAQRQFARRLAENGLQVIVLQTLSRDEWKTDNERLARARYNDREWVYRQAFHMGRHVIGYEVQRVLAAIDWFAKRREGNAKIGVAGYGEGGQVAMFAAAVDQRIDAALVSGCFDSREGVWVEPIYRNVWSRLKRFGDAEVASLVLPRQLVIEHCRFPNVSDQKGDITTPALSIVKQEFDRIPAANALPRPHFVSHNGDLDAAFSDAAVQRFGKSLGTGTLRSLAEQSPRELRPSASQEISRRRQRAMKQLEGHVQSLVRNAEHVRDRFFLYEAMPELAGGRWSTERRHPVHSQEKFVDAANHFRRQFHEEAMGRFDEPLLPPNARTRLVAETEAWRAYDVVLDVFDGLFAWGVLVLPKDLTPGERRPVVVCQHGRQGIPRDTIDNQQSAYNDFAAKLAERGFITFAPHNLYRGEDRYRWLDRKANTIGCSLFSFIIAQHDQILRWLAALPQVDGDRIAFYGLSYGGETAVRVPTILQKYCLSICSGDFNQWTRKVAATDQPFSFMNTIEWEMPYWNLGNTFDYAEMTYLMVPRPFMVERGHFDRVGRDRWVAHEFAKVRWLYAQLGLADRVEIEFFQGGHSINGEGTFAFLHQHLDWPEQHVDETAIRKEDAADSR